MRRWCLACMRQLHPGITPAPCARSPLAAALLAGARCGTGRRAAPSQRRLLHASGDGAPTQPAAAAAPPPPPAAAPPPSAPTLSELVPVPSEQALRYPDTPFALRSYQVEAIQTVIAEWKEGASAQMVMLPTGCGKTIVFASLARYLSQHFQPPVAPEAAPEPAAQVGGRDGTAASSNSSSSSRKSRPGSRRLTEGGSSPSTADMSDSGGSSSSSSPSGSRTRHRSRRLRPADEQTSSDSDSSSSSYSPSQRGAGLIATLAPITTAGWDTHSTNTSSSRSYVAAAALEAVASATSSTDGSSSSSTRGRGRQPPPACPPDKMRVLVLAHRDTLLRQAQEKFELMFGGGDVQVGWVKATRKEFYAQVVVASVATAVNCIPELAAAKFSLVVVDEAHHTVANSYRAVLEGLGFIEEVSSIPDAASSADASPSSSTPSSSGSSSPSSSVEDAGSSSDAEEGADEGADAPGKKVAHYRVLPTPNQLLLGLTATPYRMKVAESRQLYQLFTPTFTRDIGQMIAANSLSRVNSRKILTTTDLKGAGGAAGQDFVISRLSPLVNSRSRNRLVLHAWLEHCTVVDSSNSRAAAKPQRLSQYSAEEQQQQQQQRHHQVDSSSEDASDEDEEEDDDEGEFRGSLSASGRRAVRKGIGFAVDIAHAEALNEVFCEAGVRSGVVHSQLPAEVVKQELGRFRHGELDVLFNVEQLTEGFDEPSIDAVLMARPTRSPGLYTQMLGRGLRLMPGKEDCLVLDFTDKYQKVGEVLDMRVLLPELVAGARLPIEEEPPPVKGPSRIAEGLQGGEIELLKRLDFDPTQLAWFRLDSHWVVSTFDRGSIWLVATAGIGPKQRQQLSLRLRSDADADEGADDSDDDEDRYVVLHHNGEDPDPATWEPVVQPLPRNGMTEADAYGACLDFVPQLVTRQQMAAVRSWTAGSRRQVQHSLEPLFRDAPWRAQPASQKQREYINNLGIDAPQPVLTKGEAAELISRHFWRLATPEQQEQLQVWLSPDEVRDLPVPLLHAHAAKLLSELKRGTR